MKILKESHLLVVAQYLTILLPLSTILEKVVTDVIGSLVAVLFLMRSVIFRKWQFLSNDWVRYGLAFWAVQMVSALWAYDAKTAFTIGFIWGRFLFFGIAMAYWVLDSKETQRKLFISLLFTVVFLAADGIFQYYSGLDLLGNPKFDNRLTGPFSGPRLGSAILYLIFPIIAYAIVSKGKLKKKIPYIFISIFAALAILFSGDRSPTLLLLLGFAILFLLFIKSKNSASLYSLIGVIFFGLVLQVGVLKNFNEEGNNYLEERQISSTLNLIENFSQSEYGLLFKDSIGLIEKHVLLGVGAGNFRIYLCHMGYMLHYKDGCPIHPHNQYMDILANVGLLGLSLYLLMIFSIVKLIYKNFDVWSKNALSVGIVVGFLVRIWPIIFITAYTRSYSGFTFWLLAGWAIRRIEKNS